MHDGNNYATAGGEYNTSYGYDAAGNIMRLDRNANNLPSSGMAMDRLTYAYYADATNNPGNVYRYDPATDRYALNSGPFNLLSKDLPAGATNRLAWVDDAQGLARGSDLDDQLPGNYGYNPLGELTSDAAEGFTARWTAYHKIAGVDFSAPAPGSPGRISFTYDALQQRAVKHLDNHATNADITTYYVRDASGNIMSIYERRLNGNFLELHRTEAPIYGADRLGQCACEVRMDRKALNSADPMQRGMLMISEAGYDSPLSPSNLKKDEVNTGEYIVLRNTSGMRLGLNDIQVSVPQGGGAYSFAQADSLDPGQSVVLAYGSPADTAAFGLANKLPSTVFSDPRLLWKWHTTFTLPDNAVNVRLLYTSGKGAELLLDELRLGHNGISASNEPSDTTDPLRPDVIAAKRTEYEVATPVWDPTKWSTGHVELLPSAAPKTGLYARNPACRQYELKDHLGNIRVVISGIKKSDILPGTTTPTNYRAEVLVMRDYYAFGMLHPAMQFVGDDYRYGFNGQEMDNEISGEGNSYTAEFWQYDSRLGRRWNVDPLAPEYSWQSPYAAFNNNPIYYSDPTGASGEPPKDQKVIRTVGGGFMNIPSNASIATFGTTNIVTTGGVSVNLDADAVRSFSIDGNRYVAGFCSDGGFAGYYSASDMNTQYTPEPILFQDKVSAAFKDKLLEISFNLGHDPNKLMTVMAQETGETFSAATGWADKEGAVGLIQFTGIAIQEINRVNSKSYTKQGLADMTAIEQLDVVQLYYETPILKNANFETIQDYALATFNPKFVGKDVASVIYKKGEKGYLSGLDMNGDGNLTVGEVGAKYSKKYVKP